jgi:ribosome-associated heat shock protein Hsp15
VQINGLPCKPARVVKFGETIVARVGEITRTVRVISDPPSRVGAKLVEQYAEDLTPPDEYTKRREPNFIPVLLRDRGTGRPTKRERREIDEQFDETA